MIGVDQYERIRFMFAVEGRSQRAIARMLGLSRNTVRKYCQGSTLPGQSKPSSRPAPVTDAVRAIVEKWLEEDAAAPPKQRHTAQRVYDRLVSEHGFTGGGSTVRRLVRSLRGSAVEAYLPLEFSAGEAAQVDWGTAKVWLGGKQVEVHLFCMRLCHSAAPFVIAFPLERTEFFLEGHREAFEFFGGVPTRLLYDNLRTAVKKGWGRQVTEEQERFRQLRAHYAFRSEYCNPGAAHEKGLVENLVGFARRNVLVPLPRVGDWEELNARFRQSCVNYRRRRLEGRARTVAELLEQDRAALTRLPERPMDTSCTELVTVRRDGTVVFDHNRYSVPTSLVGTAVVAKGYALVVEVHHAGQVVARHPRQFDKGEVVYQLEHYLDLLAKRPRAARNAQPVRRTVPQLMAFRERMGGPNPDREFVRVLELIPRYGVEAVTEAVTRCVAAGITTSAGVLEALTGRSCQPTAFKETKVRAVSLTDYDRLLRVGGGGS